MQVNQILYTRDGRMFGNALIIEVKKLGECKAITDYGNIITLTDKELGQMFYTMEELGGLNNMAETTHKHFIQRCPQFPDSTNNNIDAGPVLSAREHFAAMAMQGIISNPLIKANAAVDFDEHVAAYAVQAANALIEELKK